MIETGNLKSVDQTKLFYRAPPPKPGQKTVLVFHGFAEHSGRYGEVLNALAAAGFSPIAVDLRGHGRSEGRRGFIHSFQDYVDDMRAAVQFAKARNHGAPVFILAHSMGALVAINYVKEHTADVCGLILSSPLLGIRVHVPFWKKKMGEIMSRYWPSLKIPGEINPDELSHDREKVEAYRKDPLIYSFVTARWFEEIQRVAKATLEAASDMEVPFLLQLSGDDRIVSSDKSALWYEKCGSVDKTKRVYEGYFHEIYNEKERSKPISDLNAWLSAH